jgi:hypothetical protein
VVDIGDASVARARVQIRNTATEAGVEAITQANGSFAFDGLAPGTYNLLVTASGFRPYVIQNIAVSGGEIRDLGRVWLEPGLLPTVTVVQGTYVRDQLELTRTLPTEIPLCLRFPGNPVLVFGPGGGLHVKFPEHEPQAAGQPASTRK